MPKFYATRIRIAYTLDRMEPVAKNAKEFVIEHKSEMTRTAATSAVVYLASRAAGFKAGYAYATAAN